MTKPSQVIAIFFAGLLSGCASGKGMIIVQNERTTSTTIHQEVTIKASPQGVYEALLDARQFGELTGFAKTEINRDVGGPFSCFNGIITGRQIELVPSERIVQVWRDRPWPPGVYSLVKFELKPEGSGTRIVFDHTGFPAGDEPHLRDGWIEHYWEPLKKHLEH